MFRKIIKGFKDVWCGALEFDTEPKKGSFNPVTSGGVYDAINGAGGAKEIVYFDVDPSDPPSGIYEAIGEALSNNKIPAIRSDGNLYMYSSTGTDRYVFVGVFSTSDVGYETFMVWNDDTVDTGKLESSLGYTTLPAEGTEEHPAWAKVCELDLENLSGYTSYGLALLFTSDHINQTDEPSESGIFIFDVGSNQSSNSNSQNASWIAYTEGAPYQKILGVKVICKYGIPSNPAYAPYPFYKAEVWVEYYGGSNIMVNALQNMGYNSFYPMSQGVYKFPENHIATTQSTEPSYSDTEEYTYRYHFYPAESPSVAYTYSQSLTSDQKAQGRDNIGAASASDVNALQSQVSSLSDVSAYTVKGEATVAQLNAGPSGIQAGWAYQLTDSGTLTDGTLAVVAGDTVAWDGTKWFPLVKSDYYATKTYAQNVAHSIAPEFDPTRTEDNQYLAGEKVMHSGSLFEFDQPHYGPWTGSDAHKVDLVDLDTFGSFIEKFCFFNLFDKDSDGVARGSYLNNVGTPSASESYNTSDFIKIRGNSSVKSSATMHVVCFYDANKDFISGSRSTEVTEITSPASAVYVRFDAATSVWNTFVLSAQANYPTDYIPYGRVRLKNTVDFDYEASKLIGAMSSQQCNFFEFNLFNISDEDVALGKYLNNGSLVSGDYNTSGYINIIEGVQYLSNKTLRFVNFFDSQKNYLSGLTNIAAETTIDVPSGAKYLRFSCTPTYWAASLMFSTVDCMPSSYMAYGQIRFKDELVTEALNFSDIGGFVNSEQCNFFEFNLFNISDENVALGKYINVNNGNLSSNSSYNTSGWISCVADKTYKSNKNIAFIGYYDVNKTFISAASAIVAGTELTPPTGASYLRISYGTTYWGDSTVFSTTANFPSSSLPFGVIRLRPSYIPTYKTYIPPKVGAFFASDSALAVDVNLGVGSYNITKNILIVAEIVGTIETVAVGVGYNGFYGCWVEITPTSVVVKRGSSATTVETLTHGMTLDGYLNVAIDNVINLDGTESAVIRMSNEHQQVYSHSISLGHPQGSIFLRNKNTSSTLACKLSFMPKDADRPVWIFGDSYCSYDSTSRWLYYVMRDMKFLNFLLAARGGESAASAIIDFRALVSNHAKLPSFAVWCMGMNNGNDGDGVPNSGWLSDTQEFLTTCDLLGITPILMTIPTVPEYSHVYMNDWIRNSGRRYIDAANAVEVAGTNTWKFYGDTEAFLSSDLVHPTTYGAKAIAAQVILDFPEISVM